jgi:hypothetical protein
MAETDKCAVSQNSSALTCDVEDVAVEADVAEADVAEAGGGELGAACAPAHMPAVTIKVAHATTDRSMRFALLLM